MGCLLCKAGLTRKDEIRGINERASGVTTVMHEDCERVYNKTDRLSRQSSKGKRQKALPLCQPCQRELPWHPLDTIAFKYQRPIDHWITRLKFYQQLEYAKLLGLLFAEKIKKRNNLPELIIPIPLHTRRLCKRGFNQSLEIAKPLSRALNIPLDIKSLKRVRHTQPQSKLAKKEREQNLIEAFRCIKPIKANHIALFDDVITTGTTINTAYQILQQNNVSIIECWCCAKTTIASDPGEVASIVRSLPIILNKNL